MDRIRVTVAGAGLMAATTVGAGMFALPCLFLHAGLGVGLLYLFVSSIVVASIHILYFRVLVKEGGEHNLLGLMRLYFGQSGFLFAVLSIVGGLLLILVAYLILGSQFLTLLFPHAHPATLLLVFWAMSSLPLLLALRRLLGLELWGALGMAAIILIIFFTPLHRGVTGFTAPPYRPIERFTAEPLALFFPFAPILFALAGWTAVEPIYRGGERLYAKGRWLIASLAFGTAIASLLYLLFVLGILRSAPTITPDTLSGLAGWPAWKVVSVTVLGLFAIWTSYPLIGLEVKTSLERDLGWGKRASLMLILSAPLVLVAAGLRSFMTVVNLVGGVFLALQYLAIILVSRKVLTLGWLTRILLDAVAAVFLALALYEAYSFILQ